MSPSRKYVSFYIYNKKTCASKLPGTDLPKSFPVLSNFYIITYEKGEPQDSADHMHLYLPCGQN